jgi:type I restriction enzyme M protein
MNVQHSLPETLRVSMRAGANLPAPDIIAAEIVEDLQAALVQFAEIAIDLKK